MGNNVKLYGGVDTRNTPGLVPGAGHDVGGSAEAGWRACLSSTARLVSPLRSWVPGTSPGMTWGGRHACLFSVMPGLVPGIHGLQHGGMRGGWVYIMTNRPNGTLYLGVTGNIARRAWEHREGMMEGFTRRYMA